MLLIGADQGDTEASRRLAHGMYAEVRRMHQLVEDLLVLTRLDEGKFILRADSIQVITVLQTVCDQAQLLARGQEIHCLVDPDLPLVRADRDRLQQVLLNMVDNALKFTPPTGLIELIAARADQDAVIIQVRDNGQGIPAEAIPHVFERFYRCDPSRSRPPQQTGGSGLGLAIAKELIEAQKGSLAIKSEQGEGTTLTIRFPAANLPEQPKHPDKRN